MTAGIPSPRLDSDSVSARRVGLAFALATLAVHLLTNSRYGYFRDELYFIACSRHLAWGYVDMAPLSALILRIEMTLFGDSLFALRLFPALAGAATVALTGTIAREMGGRVWAVTLSCTASMSALVYLGVGNFYSLNVFEPLFWMGCVYCLIRIINGASPRWWLWFGLLAGLGVENKHSMAFFGVGLAVAILLTPERRHLARPWIWLGLVIAFVLVLPNLLWQIRHDWATLELLRNVAHSNKNVVLSPAAFIGQQILIMNPATFPLWLGGLVWLLFARDSRSFGPGAGRLHSLSASGRVAAGHDGAGPPSGRSAPYRILGIAYLITLAEFIIMHGKHYYLAPVYPMLFAAGSVAVERLFAVRWRWLKPALAAVMIGIAITFTPTVVPILSPGRLVAYMKAIHFEPPRTETSHNAALPQLFADQFGWEEMVRSVAKAFATLSPEDQKRAAIFCQNYGQAGAIDFFGPRYGLPPALSGHQNYYLWGPRGYSGDVLLVLDDSGDDELEQFKSVDDLGPIESSRWAMPWEQRQHIYLCRNLKAPLAQAWPMLKEWL